MENCVTIVTTGVSYIASYLGKLIGTFYDEEGNPTKDLKRVTKRRIQAEKLVQQQKKDEEKFPNCNSRWSEANGGEVYLLLHHFYLSTVWFTRNVTFQLHGILWVPTEFTLNSLTTLTQVWCKTGFYPRIVEKIAAVPRRGPPGTRCACFGEEELNHAGLQEYEGCDPLSSTCKIK